jgi:hypothetical protein
VLEDDYLVTLLLDGPLRSVAPWTWRFAPTLTYLVHALVFTRGKP